MNRHVPRYVDSEVDLTQSVVILNYIGKRSKKMEGFNMADYLVSQQLVQEAEDIYKKLGMIKNKMMTEEEVETFWNKDDPTSHNRLFGIGVFLDS